MVHVVVVDGRDGGVDDVGALADEEGDDDEDEHQGYLLLLVGDNGMDP